MDTDTIHRAISDDGTPIAGRVHGHGPPLVLVPGGPADGETGWLALLPFLTDHFTCFAINTRGRGLSGDHPDHSRERLVEDVVAFVESIGDAVFLFGHSAGGTHALEAAAHTSAVGALALYEPTLMELANAELFAHFSHAVARVRDAVDEGRPADGAWIFIEELAMANDTANSAALRSRRGAADGNTGPRRPQGGGAIQPAPADRPFAARTGHDAGAAYARRSHAPLLQGGRGISRRSTRRLPSARDPRGRSPRAGDRTTAGFGRTGPSPRGHDNATARLTDNESEAVNSRCYW